MTGTKSTYLALLAALQLPMAANATVIDFESATTSSCQVSAGGSVDGFTLGAFDGTSGGGFNKASACNVAVPTANSGEKYMINFDSVIAEFTRDVGTFDLLSLFVHADSRAPATTVRFRGLDGVGGNLLYELDAAISASWQEVLFPGWNNVKTFTWDSLTPNSSNIAIDDFQFDVVSVPEPGTVALLGLGLFGMAAARRKKV